MAGEKTVLELLRLTTEFFEKKGIDSPRLDAELLLADVMGVDRIFLYTGFDTRPEAARVDRFREMVRKRAERCPVQYLLGETEFFSRKFKVAPAVLIPRPETEHLVQRAAGLCGELEEPLIVDLCTGSGCIAICLALDCPDATVMATDVSAEALAVATANVERHGLSERITLREGDLFDALGGLDIEGEVDVIVCNPPYVSRPELAETMPEVRDWEPRIALDGGQDGLDVIRRIADGAGEYLKPEGHLLIEVGAGQAEAAGEIVRKATRCDGVEFVEDLQEIPRVLTAHMK